MTEEIINSDGSRNWEANILLDNVKRLEQENRTNEKQIELDVEHICRLNEQIEKLEQENKEMKEIINKSARSFCNDYLKTFEENKFLNKQIMEVKFNAQQEIEFLTEENNSYRSALEEILESAKFAQCLPCGSGNLEDCLNCNDDTTNNGQFCMEKRIHDIKTKCVEVLNDSEG